MLLYTQTLIITYIIIGTHPPQPINEEPSEKHHYSSKHTFSLIKIIIHHLGLNCMQAYLKKKERNFFVNLF